MSDSRTQHDSTTSPGTPPNESEAVAGAKSRAHVNRSGSDEHSGSKLGSLNLSGLGAGSLLAFDGLETNSEGEACGPDGCF